MAHKNQPEPVKVPATVLHSLEVLRDSHQVPMLDRTMVSHILWYNGEHEAAQWVDDHPRDYLRLILCGGLADEPID